MLKPMRRPQRRLLLLQVVVAAVVVQPRKAEEPQLKDAAEVAPRRKDVALQLRDAVVQHLKAEAVLVAAAVVLQRPRL